MRRGGEREEEKRGRESEGEKGERESERRRAAQAMGANGQTFSEAEIEFLAEDEKIFVVPSFKGDTLHLISGDFGPFFPQIPVEVPLWLALALKGRGKGRIQRPEWMAPDQLSLTLSSERSSDREFQPLPFHYIEISQLLFHSESYGSDIKDKYQVRTLLKDIQDVRFHKIETGIRQLQGRQEAIKLTNLSAMEVNLVRPFFGKALTSFDRRDREG